MVRTFKISYICFLFFTYIILFLPVLSFGNSVKEQYLIAEKCYKELQKKPSKQELRENWLHCIDKLQDVYKQNPNSNWGIASFYLSGKLYWELYKISLKPSDKKEALDIFERLIKRYPKSEYRHRAKNAVETISNTDTKYKYLKADAYYQNLVSNIKKQESRANWIRCIEKFQDVYKENPNNSWAAAGLYMSGKLYLKLFAISKNESDKKEYVNIFNKVIKEFPGSEYQSKALNEIKTINKIKPQDETKTKNEAKPPKVIESQNNAGKPSTAKTLTDKTLTTKIEPAGTTEKNIKNQTHYIVSDLKFWSNPSYTRVAIYVDNETTFTHELLKSDKSANKPQRLYVDLHNSRLGTGIKKVIPINDDLLIGARAAQNTIDTVRVVIDIKSLETYKIFFLNSPFRIIIDVWEKRIKTAKAKQEQQEKPKHGTKKSINNKHTAGDLAKQLALGVNFVVIDPGHGGKDFGASGVVNGIQEKFVVLEVARKLASKIRDKLGCNVVLTRNSDKFLTLEERAAFANTKNADLFISLHANSCEDSRAHGIETYFLNLATDNDSILVAARENATSTKNISDLQNILSDLMQNAKINESSRLAGYVQKSLTSQLAKHYEGIKDKGVKQAPFYVLLGAHMPAILIETAFISNEKECLRINDPKYQDQLCDAVLNGIKNYIREINPTLLNKSNFKTQSKG